MALENTANYLCKQFEKFLSQISTETSMASVILRCAIFLNNCTPWSDVVRYHKMWAQLQHDN